MSMLDMLVKTVWANLIWIEQYSFVHVVTALHGSLFQNFNFDFLVQIMVSNISRFQYIYQQHLSDFEVLDTILPQ